jgi:hypothetical protein
MTAITLRFAMIPPRVFETLLRVPLP